jgi:uncharacterized membrane protein YeaQ/YmgE (transglycosylase-associated protein family)
VDIVLWLVIGLVAGVAAVFVVYRTIPNDLWRWAGAAAIGLIGGLIGGWLFDLFGLESTNWIGSLVIAFLGSVGILLLIRRVIPEREPRPGAGPG